LIAAIVLTRATGPVDPETAALRAATEGALRSLYDDVKPPDTYNGGPLPSPLAAAIRARVTTDIGRYFSTRLQARYLPMILDAVDQLGKSEWDAQGNLRFGWANATVHGDRAIVHVSQIGWVLRRGGQFGIDATASHRLDWSQDWTVDLVQSADGWRVDELDLDCRGRCG
jgi:hypothetical protein